LGGEEGKVQLIVEQDFKRDIYGEYTANLIQKRWAVPVCCTVYSLSLDRFNGIGIALSIGFVLA